jgi:cell division transport system permease protein
MKLDASRKEIGEIENRLRQAATGKWRFVPKEDALKRLQDSEGMAEIVASLPRNPLPDAFIVEPTNSEPEALEILRKEIAGWPKVAHVQLDSAWVKRFDAFLRLARLALWMLAGIFAAGLVAATFNTIRLQVMAQAAEIEVARMIGATDAFIRRPFYYFGALQGALGGLLAAALVLGALHLLAGPVGELAALYGGTFSLRLPGALEVAALAGIGAFLGWLGAQLSVSLSLRKFD